MSTNDHSYHFQAKENICKWNEVLKLPLGKILQETHPGLSVTDESLIRICEYLLRVLEILLTSTPFTAPRGPEEVADKVRKRLPDPIANGALSEASANLESFDKNRKSLQILLPVDKIHQLLVKEVFNFKLDIHVSVYITSVLEHIATDILKLIGDYVKNIKQQAIHVPDLDVAICADRVLMRMLYEVDDDDVEVRRACHKALETLNYDAVVKDLLLEEKQYVRELQMILKVFKEVMLDLLADDIKRDKEAIMELISNMYEFSLKLIGSLEDTIEATKEEEAALVGSIFDEFMEGQEFHVYETYSYSLLESHLDWASICAKLPLHQLKKQHMQDCIRYVYPTLLIDPFFHFIYYCDVVKILAEKSKDETDRELLRQSESQLNVIRSKSELDKKLSSKSYFKNKECATSRLVEKMDEIQASIDGWEGKNISQLCNQFITEGFLCKVSGKRQAERYCFLLDALIILTKKCSHLAPRRSVSNQTHHFYDYKLKEKFLVRNSDVVDREDTEEVKNSFEIISSHQRQQNHVVMAANSAEEKFKWMSSLFKLFNKSILARMLDVKLKEEDKPLTFPSEIDYRFAMKDSEENILFEDQAGDVPVIKGGTLLKLVERLTYHSYCDPKFSKTFLTTFRTFTNPDELLSLLIERFNIPEMDIERESMAKFRNLYIKPISFRVLNVIRQWVEHHWYDFEDNPSLVHKLEEFVATSIKSKVQRKWVESLKKLIKRKLDQDQEPVKKITFNNRPPPLEWHLERDPAKYDFMNLHPIELARQQTLLEFEVFQKITSSEMVGKVWVKADKKKTSPNLLQMIHLTTKFTFMLEKLIVETENLEERVAVMTRCLELMLVFQSLNNFNGIFEVYSAFNSASIYRLEHTFEEINKKTPKLLKILEEVRELSNNYFRGYIERLRAINPPCLPFLGMYLTNILKFEEGNPDFIPKKPSGFINFSKRRKVTEITSEIQQYQNQPYCLCVEESIKNFLLSLDPVGEMTEKDLEQYLYEQSLRIEPRHSKPVKFAKKREYPLKSPGIRASTGAHRPPHHPRHHSRHSTPQNLDDPHEGGMESGRATPRTPTSLSSPHYSSGDDVGESGTSFSFDAVSNITKREGSALSIVSSSTILSDKTITHEDPHSSPPPLPPREKRSSKFRALPDTPPPLHPRKMDPNRTPPNHNSPYPPNSPSNPSRHFTFVTK